MSRLRLLLKSAWAITRPYWFSEDRWAAWGLLLAVITLNLGIVFINVELNKWQNAFYNSLEAKDQVEFMHQLLKFCWLAAAFIVMSVYALYLNQMLQIRWRRWLTSRFRIPIGCLKRSGTAFAPSALSETKRRASFRAINSR